MTPDFLVFLREKTRNILYRLNKKEITMQLAEDIFMDLLIRSANVKESYGTQKAESEYEKIKSLTTESDAELINYEKNAIVKALNKTAWNRRKAAKLLGMTERTIYRKIKTYKLNPIT